MHENRRIFYAIQQVGFKPFGGGAFTAAHGVQSVGINTTFNLEQVFELGQLAIYENIEQIPDVEVNMEKVLDGYPLLWHLATQGAASGTLVGRSNEKTTVGLAIFQDTQESADGTPIAEVVMNELTVSSLSYSFPVDGNFTESVSLIGNHKIWRDTSMVFTGVFTSNTDAPIGVGGVQRRDNLVFSPTSSDPLTWTLDDNGQLIDLCTVLPTDIYGISEAGVNDLASGDGAKIQSITISTDLGRDQINELGRKSPYFRYVTFPIEVTTEISVVATKWDGISATEVGGENGAEAGSNLKDQSIRVYTQEGTFITTGQKNKLASVSYGGGDAGGGNVTTTYRYSTFNELLVKHPQDPTVALRGGAE